MQCSCEAFELSVGHLVEVADGCEELYVGVCYVVVAASLVLVHCFEFLFGVMEEFWV